MFIYNVIFLIEIKHKTMRICLPYTQHFDLYDVKIEIERKGIEDKGGVLSIPSGVGEKATHGGTAGTTTPRNVVSNYKNHYYM